MLVYILKSTVCLILLLGLYHLVLEKEKMHQFNRFYLLGSVVFSLLVPSFIITVSPTEFVEPVITETNISYFSSEITAAPIQKIDYTNYLTFVYILISTILFFLFGRKIYSLLQKIKQNKKVSYFKATVVLLKEQILPHTFLNYIFINKNEYQTDNLEQQILTHELTHVQQKHTLDVLFIKIMEIVFWFNPIFRFYRKAIQLNHEFLADDAVINSHKNITEYQHLLISKTAQNNNIYLASNFNYSLTKKRLLMMTTPSSKTKILLKKLLILPLTAGFVFAFAQRVEAQENKDLPQVMEIKENNNGISDKEMKEYNQLISKAQINRVFIYKNLIRMKDLYRQMSSKQQNSVIDIYKIAPPQPPISYNSKAPTISQFNSWKNKEKFAIWVDGKAIENSKLNDYKSTDFAYFTGSKVYKNARSKRFPQEFQYQLYTKSYYTKMKEWEKQQYKNVVRIQLGKEGNIIINNGTTSFIDDLHKSLDKLNVNKDKAHVIVNHHPKTDKKYFEQIRNKLRKYGIYKITFKKYPPPPPIDLVYTYNRLAKKIKASPKKKKANVQYLYSLYHKMNASQKKKVKKPSSIAPPPPPKPVVVEIIEKGHKKRKSKKQPKPVSIKVIEKTDSKELKEIIEEEEVVVEQHELREVKEGVEETEVVIDRIEPIEEVEVVEEVETPEVVEIIEEEKEFEVDNTKRIETLLKYIKSLKKKGVKFSYNKLPISYKKAKFLISKKGIHNIYAKEGKNKRINVILSDSPFVKEVIEK